MTQLKLKNHSLGNPLKPKPYQRISSIDGQHPFRVAVPAGHVNYSAKTRDHGKVVYFNFKLAKEMGLIPKSHLERMNTELASALLDTFSLQIINEWDVLHNKEVKHNKVKPHQYMATRYLQLQHKNKTGLTSGDGRSIWNGYFKGKDATWDISSCGTGATRLSPACANEKKFFKTGDKVVSYGCGRANLSEGLIAAVTSDIFYRNGIETERTLAVIAYDDGTSINVRAAKNLLRPAHFFGFLKRGDYDGLKQSIDYYIEREMQNGAFPSIENPVKRYRSLLNSISDNFARTAAIFESEYIFCWLDWDGDNILVNGGIIDYGTIRQFGLFHHEYRYDDVEKMSTTIAEQKNMAKYIVQTFAQAIDFLITGTKKGIDSFETHAVLSRFDYVFDQTKTKHLLYKVGFTEQQQTQLLSDPCSHTCIEEFEHYFSYFEKAMARRGMYTISDGITRDAIFCMRDMLRELPKYMREQNAFMEPALFIETMASDYASKRDRQQYVKRTQAIERFQASYRELIRRCAELSKESEDRIFKSVIKRTRLIDRPDRVTGDALIHIVDRLKRKHNELSFHEMYTLMERFIADQVLNPDYKTRQTRPRLPLKPALRKLYQWLNKTVADNRTGI